MLTGFKFCLERNITNLYVETDSQVFCHFLQDSKSLVRWDLGYMVLQIRMLISKFSISVAHVFREANSLADSLAGCHFRMPAFFQASSDLPDNVRRAYIADLLGIVSFR